VLAFSISKKGNTTMKIKTKVKAGGITGRHDLEPQHNHTVARGLKVKPGINAGLTGDCPDAGCGLNHNQTVARGLKIKSGVKTGWAGMEAQHNQTIACGLKVRTGFKAGGEEPPIIRG
jgi:hypothetical protein